MASNAEIEMRWVEAWNDLLELAGSNKGFCCLLPDGTVVDLEKGKAWLQNTVYAGHRVEVIAGEVLGCPGAVLLRLE